MFDNQNGFKEFAFISQGHAAFQILWAGVQFEIFQLLEKKPKLGLEQIAAELSLEKQAAKILVLGLVSLDLILKNGDEYQNSPMAKEYLLPESPNNLIDVLGWQYHIVYPGIVDFTESLKANKNIGLRHFQGSENNLYARLAHDPKLENIFQKAMSSLSRANNRNLVANADLSQTTHLVDAGGGDATNAITLCQKNPHLKVTVFDSASVCELAQKNIDQAKMSDRIFTHPGNLFENPFPQDMDCVLLSHMLTIWSPEKNTSLLRRAYEALPKGGKVLVFNMMTNDDGYGPISCTLGSVYFLSIATGQGMLYSWKDQEGFLKDAGFKNISRQVLPNDHGLLIGYK